MTLFGWEESFQEVNKPSVQVTTGYLVPFSGTVLWYRSLVPFLDTGLLIQGNEGSLGITLVMDLPGDTDLRSDPSPVAKFFRSVGVVSIKYQRPLF